MGSYISLPSPVPVVSNTIYAQRNPRVKKNNPYRFLAGWMEHFVATMSPFDVVLCQSDHNRKESENPTESCEGNQDPPKTPGVRVNKDDLFMMLALWMEDFVDETPEPYRKVGAVLALPNDVVVGADCTRDGVHAVERLLMNHYDKAEGSKMFLSRKPCPTCAKLLVQAKVSRVLCLPLKPEYYRDYKPATQSSDAERSRSQTKDDISISNNTQMVEVDELFKASSIGQTRFVPEIKEAVVEHAGTVTLRRKDRTITEKDKTEAENLKNRRFKKYELSDKEWVDKIAKELPWPTFKGNMKNKLLGYFENARTWMARVRVCSGIGPEYNFKLSKASKLNDFNGFDPVENRKHEKQARHFMEMARFLAQRTDDPTTGVGAVIVSYPKMEIVGLGWNGFPLKAHYGEYARGGKGEDNQKYSYVIHAEQNALLMRNTKNIEDAILFVNKMPCDECAPLIKMKGIKTVVVDDDVDVCKTEEQKALTYKVFPRMVGNGTFTCYQTQLDSDEKFKIYCWD